MTKIDSVDHAGLMAVGFVVKGTWQTLPAAARQAWQDLFARRAEIDAAAEDAADYVGISMGLTGDVYTEFFGVKVAACRDAPAGMSVLSVPANRYLSCEHRGKVSDIFMSFGALRDHALARGMEPTEIRLDFGYDEKMSDAAHRLYLAIAPMKAPKLLEQGRT